MTIGIFGIYYYENNINYIITEFDILLSTATLQVISEKNPLYHEKSSYEIFFKKIRLQFKSIN